MSFAQLINSEAGLTTVGALIGTVWTVFQSSEWYGRVKKKRSRRAVDALEAGVEQTYRTYVRAIKRQRADGKLTDNEIERARRLARNKAIQIARSRGVNLLRELGEDNLEMWLSRTVRESRRNGNRNRDRARN